MEKCTHTSDWWKNMVSCICCGAQYSDEEADAIANESDRAYRHFSDKEIEIIENLKSQIKNNKLKNTS